MNAFNAETHGKDILAASIHNTKHLAEAIRRQSLRRIIMVEPDLSLSSPGLLTKGRRINDILAASYAGYVAMNQKTGDDAINHLGHTMEFKLAEISSKSFSLGSQGSLIYNTSGSWTSCMGAIFHLYPGTDMEQKIQDTTLILYSSDHERYITGFVMSGEKIYEILKDKRSTTNISISAFIKDGYEIKSEVGSIGFKKYENALLQYIRANAGLLPKERALDAITNWIKLASE